MGSPSTGESLIAAAGELAEKCGRLDFGLPVSQVYNPLIYARKAHEVYLRRFGDGRKRVVFFGMNPGPWGMAQTGVPFGEVEMVRDWLGIEAHVGRPADAHPSKPVEGFSCTRSEVSGRRLWGLMRERFGAAERFFEAHFVANYCPLLFLEGSGRNRTPDKLKAAEKAALFRLCDQHLRETIRLLEPRWAIGVGRFAEGRIRSALAAGPTRAAGGGPSTGGGPKVGGILHPSPASPRANRGWAAIASDQLKTLGVWR